MLIVQKVSLALDWVILRQNQIIPLEIINLVEVVADHNSVLFVVLRILLPDGAEVTLHGAWLNV